MGRAGRPLSAGAGTETAAADARGADVAEASTAGFGEDGVESVTGGPAAILDRNS